MTKQQFRQLLSTLFLVVYLLATQGVAWLTLSCNCHPQSQTEHHCTQQCIEVQLLSEKISRLDDGCNCAHHRIYWEEANTLLSSDYTLTEKQHYGFDEVALVDGFGLNVALFAPQNQEKIYTREILPVQHRHILYQGLRAPPALV